MGKKHEFFALKHTNKRKFIFKFVIVHKLTTPNLWVITN